MAAPHNGFLPRRDRTLLEWSSHFHRRISDSPGDFGLPLSEVIELQMRIESFEADLAQVEPAIRTKTMVARKNQSRRALCEWVRGLAHRVYSHPTITKAQLTELGLTVRKKWTRVSAPQTAPTIDVKQVNGRRVVLELHDCLALVRRKPPGARRAMVWTYFGEKSPEKEGEWRFQVQSGRTKLTLDFPETTGSNRLWISACWCNAKGERGPVCEAVAVELARAISMPRAYLENRAA